MSGFHGAFATGVASQQGTLTLPDTWFRPPFWDLLVLQLLRPNFSNLPCLYSTFHFEYPLVLSRFCLWCYIIHYVLFSRIRSTWVVNFCVFVRWLCSFCDEWEGWPCKTGKAHQLDGHKLVCNRCVIELIDDDFLLSLCFSFKSFVGVRDFTWVRSLSFSEYYYRNMMLYKYHLFIISFPVLYLTELLQNSNIWFLYYTMIVSI